MHYATIENLSKSFGVRQLFNNLTFHIEEGDKIALVARNGYCKSTLLHIIAGQDYADSGTVWVHKDIQLVMLHQENEFEENKNIWDNILGMNHPTVKVVKAYEEFIESGKEDINKMQDLSLIHI